MKPATDIPDEAAEKLLRLMTEADGGQPFMTHRAAATLGAFILAELGKIAQQSEEAGKVKQEWGTSGQIALIYGLHPKTTPALLKRWVAAGKVRVCSIPNDTKDRRGNNRFNLLDVQKMMMPADAEVEAEKKRNLPFPLP